MSAPAIAVLAVSLLAASFLSAATRGSAAATPEAVASCQPPIAHTPAPPAPTIDPVRAAPTPTPGFDQDAPVDPLLAPMAATAAQQVQACWNAGNWEAVASLVTPRFVETAFGITAPTAPARAEALASLDLGALRIVEVGPVGIWSDGRGVIDVFYKRGHGNPDQAVAARWFFRAARGAVTFDEEALRPPPPLGDRITAGFSIPDDRQPLQWASPASSRLPVSPVTALHGANRGSVAHTVILQRHDGQTLGLLTLPAGQQASLLLLDLPPGTYRLIDPAVPGSELSLRVMGDG